MRKDGNKEICLEDRSMLLVVAVVLWYEERELGRGMGVLNTVGEH